MYLFDSFSYDEAFFVEKYLVLRTGSELSLSAEATYQTISAANPQQIDLAFILAYTLAVKDKKSFDGVIYTKKFLNLLYVVSEALCESKESRVYKYSIYKISIKKKNDKDPGTPEITDLSWERKGQMKIKDLIPEPEGFLISDDTSLFRVSKNNDYIKEEPLFTYPMARWVDVSLINLKLNMPIFLLKQFSHSLSLCAYDLRTRCFYEIATLYFEEELGNKCCFLFLLTLKTCIISTGTQLILFELEEKNGRYTQKKGSYQFIIQGDIHNLQTIHNHYIAFGWDNTILIYNVEQRQFVRKYSKRFDKNTFFAIHFAPNTKSFLIQFARKDLPIVWHNSSDEEGRFLTPDIFCNLITTYKLPPGRLNNQNQHIQSFILMSYSSLVWLTAYAREKELLIFHTKSSTPYFYRCSDEIVSISWVYIDKNGADKNVAALLVIMADFNVDFIWVEYKNDELSIYSKYVCALDGQSLTEKGGSTNKILYAHYDTFNNRIYFITKDNHLVVERLSAEDTYTITRMQKIVLEPLGLTPSMFFVINNSRYAKCFILAVANEKELKVYQFDSERGTIELLVERRLIHVTHMAIDTTGQYLAVVLNHNKLIVYDLDKKEEHYVAGPFLYGIHDICFTYGSYLVILFQNGKIGYITLLQAIPKLYMAKFLKGGKGIQVQADTQLPNMSQISVLPLVYSSENFFRILVTTDSQIEVFFSKFEKNEPLALARPVLSKEFSGSTSKQVASTLPQIWQIPSEGQGRLRNLPKGQSYLEREAAVAAPSLIKCPEIRWPNAKITFPSQARVSGKFEQLTESDARKLKIQCIQNAQGINTNDFICWDDTFSDSKYHRDIYEKFIQLAAEGGLAKSANGDQGLKKISDSHYSVKLLGAYGDLRAIAESIETTEIDGKPYRLFKLVEVITHTEMDRRKW